MLTKQSLEIIKWFTKYGQSLSTSPYDWDIKTGSIVVGKSWLQKILFRLTGLHLLGLLFYLIHGLHKELHSNEKHFNNILWLILWTMYYTYMSCSFYNACAKNTEIATLFKGLKLINDKFQGSFFVNSNNKIHDALFKL